MRAEIITIGDEILIGQIVDTNSAWMAQKLNLAGIKVKQISSVSDDRQHILEALNESKGRADLILITGGLGPTKDDITKKTLAEYFNTGFRLDQDALENVRRIFSKYKAPLLESNIKQAEVLENCITLLNLNGTAPGMWIEHEDRIFVSMPGVPFEMMYMMEELVIPKIKKTFKLPVIVHHTILTAGIGESILAEKIASVEDSLPAHIKLAYLPKLGTVRIRLSGNGQNEELLKNEISVYVKRITDLVSEFVMAEKDTPIEKVVMDYMESRKLTLSVAESCTGGYISHQLTQHPGSSKVFLGAAVTYSNELKISMLGVLEETLRNYGAVSEETVKEMAKGAHSAFHSDYSIAVSGIAGPDGGTEEKPVGTIWIAITGRSKTISRKYNFGNKRIQNIERSATTALIMLYKLMNQEQVC
ncbi:MAG: competence/damage-inducible protein A [Daejeonella sp.]|uniref:competence/damage-inducible protein A n=1 Tax=Daejeonella sp. TaxID=2805397 RepID=UPI0027334BB9|nr:competence/damage-inducible protein A [Daejeonella sp.]MDP3468233.1 competence/damage-inducible protein A [Daejeonella sp.]